MALLIITQKISKNDPILGFFHNWVKFFAESSGEVFVIANEVGEYDLPANVKVFSLGKERGRGRLARYSRFMFLALRLVRRSEGIFAHMCPEYVIAVSPIAKIFNKKIALWYVHRSINFRLWLAEKFTDKIFTVSDMSCGVKSKKIEITGHGIDTDNFRFAISDLRFNNKEFFNILSVGRISPIKDCLTFARAADILINQKGIKNIKIFFAGEAYLPSDKDYKDELVKFIDEKGLKAYVVLMGAVSQTELLKLYNSHDLLVNLCPTGGMDKVVLEAGACELPSLAANEAFSEFLGKDLVFKHGDANDLAEKIIIARKMDLPAIGKELREKVVASHNLKNLIGKIAGFFTCGHLVATQI